MRFVFYVNVSDIPYDRATQYIRDIAKIFNESNGGHPPFLDPSDRIVFIPVRNEKTSLEVIPEQ